MIDLHSHVLPGVDDGARDLEQSLNMCRLSLEDGCHTMMATPHLRHERFWNGDRGHLERVHRRLCQAVASRFGDRFKVLLGGEIAVGSESLAELEQPSNSLLPLAGSSYVLMEPSFHGMGPDPIEMVYELGVRGRRTIIAHPERISWLTRDLGLMAALVEQGALMQLTAMSLTGELGAAIQEVCRIMIDRGWVHFVASDCHDDRLRPPRLSAARGLVEASWGEAAAERLFLTNAEAVLADRSPDEIVAVASKETEVSSAGGWGRRWQRLRSRVLP